MTQYLSPAGGDWLARPLVWRVSPAAVLLGLIVLFSLGLHFTNLQALGDGNPYYTAAVKSMLQSWPNFFFAAAEPGGSVSIDKPPLGFWLQTLSAGLLGVSGFAVILPQIIAGVLSVILAYALVRRSFGAAAGLLAALALALTPVAIAANRNNTVDSTLIFTLLLASWAFVRATESGKLPWLLLGAALVGIGFNIKMLAAYLVLPALYALYFFGAHRPDGRAEKLPGKLGKLALATVLLLAVSFSWAAAVDLTPADRRPYIISSRDNTEFGLIFGYNGAQRLLSGFGRPNRPTAPPAGQPANSGPGGGQVAPGISDTGQPGLLRLFQTPLNKEASWLLPFGLLSAALLGLSGRPGRPLGRVHRALLLWGGWLATGALFFSVAGFFHQYYLSILAPPLAALTGIGLVRLWDLYRIHPWRALILLVAGTGAALALQIYTILSFIDLAAWVILAATIFTVGTLLAGLAGLRRSTLLAAGSFTALTAAMLLAPGIWSIMTVTHPAHPALPQAYPALTDPAGGGPPARGPGKAPVDPALLAYLQENTWTVQYLVAAPSSLLGSGYILATGRPVFLIGGFNGSDRVIDGAGLSQMTEDGRLRYILWYDNGAPPHLRNPEVSAWVASHCKTVSLPGAGGPGGLFEGGLRLYDCAQ